MSLINNLGKISILNEAPNDELFDIDKEVDAHIKRVENRIAKKQAMEQPQQEEQPPVEDTPDNVDNTEEETQEQNPEDTEVSEQEDETPEGEDNTNTDEELNTDGDQSDEYDYMGDDNSDSDIPDDYEPKQTIPELRILSTLSDKEYALCNIKIIESFQTLKRNVENTSNNLIPLVTTKNIRQRQAISIVKKNLYQMAIDINNYIMYRNNNVYEENVRAYLTYLKRYQIATNIIKLIIDENSIIDK